MSPATVQAGHRAPQQRERKLASCSEQEVWSVFCSLLSQCFLFLELTGFVFVSCPNSEAPCFPLRCFKHSRDDLGVSLGNKALKCCSHLPQPVTLAPAPCRAPFSGCMSPCPQLTPLFGPGASWEVNILSFLLCLKI